MENSDNKVLPPKEEVQKPKEEEEGKPPGTGAKVDTGANEEKAADAKDDKDAKVDTGAKVENKEATEENKDAKETADKPPGSEAAATSASEATTTTSAPGATYQPMSNTTGDQNGLNPTITQNTTTSQSQTDESQSQSLGAVAEEAYGDQGNGQNPYNGQNTGNGQNPYNGQNTGNGQNPYNGQNTVQNTSQGTVQNTSRGRDQQSISGDFASINFTIGTSSAENDFLKEMLECQMKINKEGDQISMDQFFQKLHDCEIQNITKHKISNGFGRLIQNYNGQTIISLTQQQVDLIQTLTGICGSGSDSGFVNGTTLNSSQFLQYINNCVQNDPNNKNEIKTSINNYLNTN